MDRQAATSCNGPAPKVSVAPMMDLTDRHYRYLVRLLTRHALLYTEMIHVNAVLLGDRHRHLDFSAVEHPVALQLGGDDPKSLAQAARIAQEWGYDEVNLNVGCPSDRVQSGNFGACLMADPVRVAELVAAMREGAELPVTVKHRIGIDHLDSYELLGKFVDTVAQAGTRRFIIHARKAWLKGLSPKENREIPPLRYDDVYRLKRDFPDLHIEINGGVKSYVQVEAHLEQVDAVMVGRKAYEDPYWLAGVDGRFLGEAGKVPPRGEVVELMLPYLENQLSAGVPLARMTRHMLALFSGLPGARTWRRILSENAHRPGAGIDVVQRALAALPQSTREAGAEPKGQALATA